METLVSIGLVQLMAVISPGPSFLVTVQTAAARSQLDGVKVALGLSAGAVTWATAAVLGLHLVFQRFAWLYLGMQIAGSLYLLWIAVQMLRHAAEPLKIEATGDADDSWPFVRGYLTQISNPKTVAFFASIFLVMLPSEVPAWMSVALIAICGVNDFSWYAIVAVFFGAAPVRRFYIDAKAWIERLIGVFLACLGGRLLWLALAA
jgi:threonine/homoserine/homoserine lactone efflux protein